MRQGFDIGGWLGAGEDAGGRRAGPRDFIVFCDGDVVFYALYQDSMMLVLSGIVALGIFRTFLAYH